MRVSVVILYRFEKVEDTPIFVTVAAVRCRRKGKITGGVFNFLIPAKYDYRSNGYEPDLTEQVYNMEEDTYWESIFDFVSKRFGCTYSQTKLLKVKDINQQL